MAIGQGVIKQTRFKRQSAKGTMATAPGAQVLRRKKSTFELAKETYSTEAEINSAQQLISNRHGARTVNGKVSGLLSPGTYSDMLGALLRRDFAALTAIASLSITISGSGPTYTVARAAGSWLTDGVKTGMVGRLSGGSFNAANLNKNLLVTAVTALNLTVMPLNGVALVAEGPIASSTFSAPGKLSFVPASGHTNIYYTVEEWMSDVPASERNTDVKVGKADFSLPGSGNAELDMSFVGLDQSSSTSAYFTSPTAETSTGNLVAASGLLLIGGVTQAVVTDLKVSIDGKESPADAVVGATVRPDTFRGKVMVSGSFTAYFDSTTIADAFRSETNVAIVAALSADGTAAADFISFVIPRVDVAGSSPDDNETGLKRTYSFIAEYNSAGGAGASTEATTIWIQDSQAA